MDVLVVIDMQTAPFAQNNIFDQENIVERINILSEYIRSQGGRVVFVQHNGIDEEGLKPHTPGWCLLSTLIVNSETDYVIRKVGNDAFYKTDLSLLLKKHKAERLIIAGWATDLCVDTTVRSAVSREYNVIVAADYHTLSDRPHLGAKHVIEHHNWVWKNLLTVGNAIDVVSTKELCDK
ncbi:MAG: isochorismatase family protein [Spongiibacteraceae bacterium]|nr:isochorismatase family protein [Spongiibacteraceae bacterium]